MSQRESFVERIKETMGSKLDSDIPRGDYRGKQYNHICKNLSSNFIDGKIPEYCNIKGKLFRRKIKYHKYSKHLNSSQVMCISFFKKLFEKEEYEQILIDVLRKCGVSIADGVCIENAIFEFEPDRDERTNLDFYMIMSNGQRLSFEIKYTEVEFGSISNDKNDPDKYHRKWNEIYKKRVSDSPFLDCSENDFYQNYQINRNIVIARTDDQVIFLTPRANNARGIVRGREYIEKKHEKFSGIMNIYWEDIYKTVISRVNEDVLKKYYIKFGEKYISILDQ